MERGDEVEEADGKEDKLVGMVRKSLLMVVLAAVFLPLDIMTLTTLFVGGVYIFRKYIGRLLGYYY